MAECWGCDPGCSGRHRGRRVHHRRRRDVGCWGRVACEQRSQHVVWVRVCAGDIWCCGHGGCVGHGNIVDGRHDVGQLGVAGGAVGDRHGRSGRVDQCSSRIRELGCWRECVFERRIDDIVGNGCGWLCGDLRRGDIDGIGGGRVSDCREWDERCFGLGRHQCVDSEHDRRGSVWICGAE